MIDTGHDFSVTQHVHAATAGDFLRADSVRAASVKVADSQGLNNAALQHVYHTIVIVRMTYAASAWHDFIKASDRQRINS